MGLGDNDSEPREKCSNPSRDFCYRQGLKRFQFRRARPRVAVASVGSQLPISYAATQAIDWSVKRGAVRIHRCVAHDAIPPGPLICSGFE